MKVLKNLEIISMDSGNSKGDILIEGKEIGLIGRINIPDDIAENTDYEGLTATPGLVDSHVHVLGGGGEGGPGSRPIGPTISDLIVNGVTSVVGVLGFDGYTRSLLDLHMRTRALKEMGMNAYMMTGAYPIPTPTITEDIIHDILLIDEVIGIGEIAISDRRGMPNSLEKLTDMVHKAYHSYLLTGKGSVINFHLGDHIKDPLSILYKLKDGTPIPSRHILPTHINRSEEVLVDALRYVQSGGYGDITCGFEDMPLYYVMEKIRDYGVDMSRFTLTTDAGGSEPIFDENGVLTGLDVTREDILTREIKMAIDHGFELKDILPLVTSNPASIHLLKNCGTLSPGKRADIIIWEDNKIKDVYMNGNLVVKNGKPLIRERLRETKNYFE